MLKTTGAEADVTFLGVAAGGATSVIRIQTGRQPADFYSPDTFNYKVLDVSADGKTLTVTS